MRTHIEFRTDKFPEYEDEDIEDAVNPGRFGRRLAEHLQAKLPERGVLTEEPFAEDWGWVVRRWFKKIDTTEFVGRVAEALDAILQADPDVRHVRWWSEEEAAR